MLVEVMRTFDHSSKQVKQNWWLHLSEKDLFFIRSRQIAQLGSGLVDLGGGIEKFKVLLTSAMLWVLLLLFVVLVKQDGSAFALTQTEIIS